MAEKISLVGAGPGPRTKKKRALIEGPSVLPLVANDQSKYLRNVMPQVRGWFG